MIHKVTASLNQICGLNVWTLFNHPIKIKPTNKKIIIKRTYLQERCIYLIFSYIYIFKRKKHLFDSFFCRQDLIQSLCSLVYLSLNVHKTEGGMCHCMFDWLVPNFILHKCTFVQKLRMYINLSSIVLSFKIPGKLGKYVVVVKSLLLQ